jgi:hypothetical protein
MKVGPNGTEKFKQPEKKKETRNLFVSSRDDGGGTQTSWARRGN